MVDQHMSSFRTMFNTDVANLTQYTATLDGEVKKYQSLEQHYAQEEAAIQKRIDVINSISIAIPLVKLGSELESLVATGKTTEAQLSEARSNVAKYAKQRTNAQHAEVMTQKLSGEVSSLATSVQNARNAVSIIESKLGNESSFVNAANENDAVLYLNALKASVTQLQNLAA